jgi:erythronate-4-phosphate dehydrogenase
LVNAARGEVVDNQALLEVLKQRDDLAVFLDTWENEPLISRELMRRVDLATPHIAGYSVEGRLRGTQMILDAACDFFAQPSSWRMSQQLPEVRTLPAPAGDSKIKFWQSLFASHCDVWRDDEALKAGKSLDDAAFARHFDSLRRVYADRLEYDRFAITGALNKDTTTKIQRLNFRIN